MIRRVVGAVLAAAAWTASPVWGQTCWGVPIQKAGAAVVVGVGAWESQIMLVARPPGRFTLRGYLHGTGEDDAGTDNAWLLGGSVEMRRRGLAVCPLAEVGRHQISDGDPSKISAAMGRVGLGMSVGTTRERGWNWSVYAAPQYTVVRSSSTFDALFGLSKKTYERGTVAIEGGMVAHRRHFFGALIASKLPYTAEPLREDGHVLLRLGWVF